MATLGQSSNDHIFRFQEFQNKLYAGINQLGGDEGNLAQLWVTSNGTDWSQVAGYTASYQAITAMDVFNGYLYTAEIPYSIVLDSGNTPQTIKVQRSADGVTWETVLDNTLIGDTDLKVIWSIKTFEGHLYATSLSYDNDTASSKGLEVLRTSDGTTWEKVATAGFNGDVNNLWSVTMEEFNGYLYIGTLNVNLSLEPSAGTEVWRSDTGAAGTWQQSNQDGFGIASPENNFLTFAMVVFKGELYATVYNWSEETEDSIQLWKTADGQSWSQVVTSGLGTGQGATDSLFMPMVINGVFYMGNDQASGAASLYSSSDGANWQDTNHEGSADANNYGLYAMTLFSNYMYSGFSNESGAQIWRAGPINPLAINTSSLPPAVLGNDYTATIDVASGTTPYTCSYSGDLPPGLTLSSSCVISGAPTHASDHTFTLSVRDSGTPYQTASKSLTISVSPGLPETGTGGIPRPVYSKPLLDLTYFYAMLAQKD